MSGTGGEPDVVDEHEPPRRRASEIKMKLERRRTTEAEKEHWGRITEAHLMESETIQDLVAKIERDQDRLASWLW